MEYKIGDTVKYRVNTYGYFYGDCNVKRMVVALRTGRITGITRHNNRVVFYTVEMIKESYPYKYVDNGVIDSIYPEEIEGVI